MATTLAEEPVDVGARPTGRLRVALGWLLAGVVLAVVGDVLQHHLWWRGTSWLFGLYVIWSLAVPCLMIAVCPRRWAVPLALAITALPMVLSVSQNLRLADPTYLQKHDGGVVVTDAAADLVIHGKNPYRADYATELGKRWARIARTNGTSFANPIVDHYPYLPAAFLVTIPPRELAHAFGLGWDPRILYLAVVLATLLVIAKLDRSPLVRAAMICGVGSGILRLFLAWGTNDAIGSCLFLLALLLAYTRPKLAGALLAVAISFKFLFLVPAIPLAVLVHRRSGWAGLRKWWTAPATLAATILPFFLAGPGHFIQDTVLFNLGLTKPTFPTSGIGLPATAPGVFHGPLLALTTVGLFVLGLGAAVYAVRRWPNPAVAALGGALALVGLLLPARTFQEPYLTLIAVLLPAGWLLLRLPGDPALPG